VVPEAVSFGALFLDGYQLLALSHKVFLSDLAQSCQEVVPALAVVYEGSEAIVADHEVMDILTAGDPPLAGLDAPQEHFQFVVSRPHRGRCSFTSETRGRIMAPVQASQDPPASGAFAPVC